MPVAKVVLAVRLYKPVVLELALLLARRLRLCAPKVDDIAGVHAALDAGEAADDD